MQLTQVIATRVTLADRRLLEASAARRGERTADRLRAIVLRSLRREFVDRPDQAADHDDRPDDAG